MVRPDAVRRLLGVLLDNLSDLDRYRDRITLAQLRTDRDTQHLVLHALYLAVQASVDLALHIGADTLVPQSGSYGDAFRRLGTSGALDPALAERLAGWAGLRNVLAHFYPIVDYDRVHAALHETRDLRAFAEFVACALDATPPNT